MMHKAINLAYNAWCKLIIEIITLLEAEEEKCESFMQIAMHT